MTNPGSGRERWLSGLTWKGVAILAFVCAVNALRRMLCRDQAQSTHALMEIPFELVPHAITDDALTWDPATATP